MNVLFVHQSSEMYGSDKVLLYLADGLRSAGKVHPVVILPDDGPLYSALVSKGIEVHVGEVAKISRAAFTPRGLFALVSQVVRSVRNIDKILKGRSIDIVHSNTLAVLSGAAWAFARGKRHLWHVHEIILKPSIISKGFPILVDLFSNRVISNSTMTERWLLSERARLVSRSTVVFNGLPEVQQPTESSIDSFRDSVGAGPSDVVVTLAGRINRWKGQELLVEAASVLKRTGRFSGLRFVVVGSAAPGMESLPAQLQAKAVAEGVDKSFSFISFVDDVWPVWFGSDIAVVPSTEPEPFGMVAIEAMAAGLPVIAAAHGGLLDIVVEGRTGILFSPGNAVALADAIGTLAADRDCRARFGEAGARRQRDVFSVDAQVESTSRVYEEIVA
ncbi:MAG: glycosyltransferase family 4 protein [Denitromonas halophila]|nr:MAG: glycosyltransferase family 4 protein [Denitromonas halophila]